MQSVLVPLHFVITTMKLFTYAQVHTWIRISGGECNSNGECNNNSSFNNRERSMSESDGDAVFAKICQKSGTERLEALF